MANWSRFVIRFILLFLLTISFQCVALSYQLPTVEQVQTNLESAEKHGDTELSGIYKNSLSWIEKRNFIQDRQKEIYHVINNFTQITQNIREEINDLSTDPHEENEKKYAPYSIERLSEEVLNSNKNLIAIGKRIQDEQDIIREILDSIPLFPQKQSQTTKLIHDLEMHGATLENNGSVLLQAKIEQYQIELATQKEQLDLINLEQESVSIRQELALLNLDLFKKQYQIEEDKNNYLKTLITAKRDDKVKETIKSAVSLDDNEENLPEIVKTIVDENKFLSAKMTELSERLKSVSSQQNAVTSQIDLVKQALNTLSEQAKWLNMSTALGEMMRAQLSKLPQKPKLQRMENEIADVRLQRLNYEELLRRIESQENVNVLETHQVENADQRDIYNEKIKAQKALLQSLIAGSNSLALELSKLKISNNQLSDELDEVKNASHRYFFWVADVDPIGINYPSLVLQDLETIVSLETFTQLGKGFAQAFQDPIQLFLIIFSLLFVYSGFKMKKSYFDFLDRTSSKLGKVTLDNFLLTLRTVNFSLLIAAPIPILWWAIGLTLKNAWEFPISVALGTGMNAASPFLWAFMIIAAFSYPKGLFVAHFGWPIEQVKNAMRYYRLSVWVIIPLVIFLVALNTYNDRQFAATLGRLCFIFLCIALIFVTKNIHRAKVPLYLDKHGLGDNFINNFLWAILLVAPWLAILSACIGYLSTSQTLLVRLEASVLIWFILLLIYYLIRRWMFIQRRKIEFDRAKQKRAERLAQRAKSEDSAVVQSSDGVQDIIEEPVINLDVISAQSLRLIRSILSMIALVSIILLWSELHSAFSFLDNITLWRSTVVTQGVETSQRITLASLLIAIVVMLVTTQLVKNFPALLELGVLQHLDLTPGTGYAISTLSKYIILLIGGIISFSIIGIDWAKIQWLVAALGLGLGFGLQEIFANFISGLILLFEKPIRIGDTITIRNLTGTVSKINTRATTIVDWDRKEIVMPNKAFITEQLINWSLTDSVTRIVLTIPASMDVDSALISDILKESAKECTYVLNEPNPEVYLVDIQEGIQLFELRVFASEMGQRMPLRNEIHQIIVNKYKEHNIQLPFPPFQARVDVSTNKHANRRVYDMGSL